MRLVSLTANRSSFRPIHFRPEGLSLILGTSSADEDSSSNGVGKSLSLRLIHHCLGAQSNRKLADALPGWSFRLALTVNGTDHIIERSADSKLLALDENSVSQTKLREFLNQRGPFSLGGAEGTHLSFRALVKRFARLTQADCESPIASGSEGDYQALIATLFLLGLDIDLAVHKYRHKKSLDRLHQARRLWRESPDLREIFRAGNDARVRADWLRERIPVLREQLDALVVAENYEEIEQRANIRTQRLRELEREIELLWFQARGVREQLDRPADISRQELLSLYAGLEEAFKPEALRHFEAVEEFHSSLAERRRRRLSAELARLSADIEDKSEQKHRLGRERDADLQMLQGKTAFEEYRSVANDLAAKDQELKALEEYLDLESSVDREMLTVRQTMLREAEAANEYIDSDPLRGLEARYRELTRRLYPQAASGISLENNTGENLLRYNLRVHLEAAGSDGVRDAMILCFDWLVFMYGANHAMDFIWHDNRLFAHLDPGVRARWFSHVLANVDRTGKQYIATINFENFNSMRQLLEREEWGHLQEATVLSLDGDDPSHKLLGVQVDL